MNKVLKPIAMTEKTVTVSRADWKRIMERLEEAEDRMAVRRSLARKRLAQRQCASRCPLP